MFVRRILPSVLWSWIASFLDLHDFVSLQSVNKMINHISFWTIAVVSINLHLLPSASGRLDIIFLFTKRSQIQSRKIHVHHLNIENYVNGCPLDEILLNIKPSHLSLDFSFEQASFDAESQLLPFFNKWINHNLDHRLQRLQLSGLSEYYISNLKLTGLGLRDIVVKDSIKMYAPDRSKLLDCMPKDLISLSLCDTGDREYPRGAKCPVCTLQPIDQFLRLQVLDVELHWSGLLILCGIAPLLSLTALRVVKAKGKCRFKNYRRRSEMITFPNVRELVIEGRLPIGRLLNSVGQEIVYLTISAGSERSRGTERQYVRPVTPSLIPLIWSKKNLRILEIPIDAALLNLMRDNWTHSIFIETKPCYQAYLNQAPLDAVYRAHLVIGPRQWNYKPFDQRGNSNHERFSTNRFSLEYEIL